MYLLPVETQQSFTATNIYHTRLHGSTHHSSKVQQHSATQGKIKPPPTSIQRRAVSTSSSISVESNTSSLNSNNLSVTFDKEYNKNNNINMQKAPNSTGNISLQAGGGVGGVGGGSVNNSGSDNNTAGSHQMKPLRSESFAYPRSPHQDLLSRMKFYARQHAQPVVATLAFVVFVLFVSSDYVHTNGLRGSVKGYVT